MKSKWIARILCILLCLGMLLSLVLPAFAAEEETEEAILREITITSVEEFLEFSENCRLDSYSVGLTVQLRSDIDLTGTGFSGVPSFSGTFRGNHRTISGLELTADGSVQGLFRYLTESARVESLRVRGQVTPGGSRSIVGGIAGENRGIISYCSFSGTVSGGDTVGGLVGRNTVTGVIEGATSSGSISGNHFVGGIAGENSGVIRSSKNHALVNTDVQQNQVSISDITMDTLTNSESADTATDIGGIAGTSSGVIRACKNRGNVGYQLMGYNVGGIAGSQSGYIVDSENYAQIHGRKEVGGIVGHQEPAMKIAFTEDALQKLSNQVSGLMGSLNKLSTTAGNMGSEIGKLQSQADSLGEALDALKPENGELPDPDSIQAAQNTLADLMQDMTDTMDSTATALESTVKGMGNTIRSMSGQLNTMMATINNASENLGGTLVDVSDGDTDLDWNAKVEHCANYGNILADYNAGGIAGVMATESDLDTEKDLELTGDSSLNFEGEIRAVILNCENTASVSVNKENGGGIAGGQYMGLVKDCRSTGTLECAAAQYVGGISGVSYGFIRSSSANCEIYGDSYVGGIAGSADMAADCHSMVLIYDARERYGSILGFAEETSKELEAPISGNVYVSINQDIGGIDGVSYAGQAEPMALEQFLKIEDLHDMFQKITYTFIFEDGTETTVSAIPGGNIDASAIPQIPGKDGWTAVWEGLDTDDLTNVMYDMTFQAVYTRRNETIRSTEIRENGQPVMLLQGSFALDTQVTLSPSDTAPEQTEDTVLLEAWNIHCTNMADATAARLKLPDGVEISSVTVHLCNTDGLWTETEFTADGSHLVFSVNETVTAVALMQSPESFPVWAAAAGTLAIGLTAVLILRRKKKRGPPPLMNA